MTEESKLKAISWLMGAFYGALAVGLTVEHLAQPGVQVAAVAASGALLTRSFVSFVFLAGRQMRYEIAIMG
jgi:hypothetical protein